MLDGGLGVGGEGVPVDDYAGVSFDEEGHWGAVICVSWS